MGNTPGGLDWPAAAIEGAIHITGRNGSSRAGSSRYEPRGSAILASVKATIAVWNCADATLGYALDEVAGIERLRSADVDVVAAGGSVEWVNLSQFLGVVKPTVFHFIGHGRKDGTLCVNEGANSVWRSIESVLELVRAASPSIQGVFLSGCFTSSIGPASLEVLAPSGGWVVGTSSRVDDDLAAEFAVRFYDHLYGASSDVSTALDVAKAYIKADLQEDPPYDVWMTVSSLPPVDAMARTVSTALRTVLMRSAMQTPMRYEVSIDALDVAMQDIAHALGTGQILNRRTRQPIDTASFPAEWLHDPVITKFVRQVQASFAEIRRDLRVLRAGASGHDQIIGNMLNFDDSVSRATWMKRVNSMDRGRNKIIRATNELMAQSGLPPLPTIEASFSRKEIAAASP